MKPILESSKVDEKVCSIVDMYWKLVWVALVGRRVNVCNDGSKVVVSSSYVPSSSCRGKLVLLETNERRSHIVWYVVLTMIDLFSLRLISFTTTVISIRLLDAMHVN